VLTEQREKLASEAKRYARMLRTIDRTIENLKGDRAMKDADLYKGVVSPEKQAEHEAWLVNRYGGDMSDRIAHSKKSYAAMSAAEKRAAMDELQAVEQGLAEAMRLGVPAQSTTLDPLLERYRDWLALMWAKPCSPEALSGLADLHLGHPDFVSRHEAVAEGFSDWHAVAMKAWAGRQSV
jgi:hypothetical protein